MWFVFIILSRYDSRKGFYCVAEKTGRKKCLGTSYVYCALNPCLHLPVYLVPTGSYQYSYIIKHGHCGVGQVVHDLHVCVHLYMLQVRAKAGPTLPWTQKTTNGWLTITLHITRD